MSCLTATIEPFSNLAKTVTSSPIDSIIGALMKIPLNFGSPITGISKLVTKESIWEPKAFLWVLIWRPPKSFWPPFLTFSASSERKIKPAQVPFIKNYYYKMLI